MQQQKRLKNYLHLFKVNFLFLLPLCTQKQVTLNVQKRNKQE